MIRRLITWIKRKLTPRRSTPVIRSPRGSSSDFTPHKYIKMYQDLWDTMELRPDKASSIKWYVKEAFKNRERYEKVSSVSNVPWEVIACIHALESGYSFKGVLHNGDEIIGKNRKTYRVPKGRGPFESWEEAAVDALMIKKSPDKWDIANTLHYLERFNGLGYLRDNSKPNSPYIWSFSFHYTRGKYVRDGRYSKTAVSGQCGAAVILKGLGYGKN